MKNTRLLLAAALTMLGACTASPTGPDAAVPSAGSENVTSPTDPTDQTTVVEVLDDTGLVGPGGGRT